MSSESAFTKSIWEKLPTRVLAGVLLLILIAGCDSRRPRPYITPSVRFNKATAPIGTPVEMEYRFRTSVDFQGLKKDLIVFVHFLDPRGTIRFVDDHTPPIRTNQWGPGQEYSYRRTVFLPENIPAGEYVVELGMYTPSGKGERFALNARRISERSYDVGHLQLQQSRPDDIGEFTNGWYDIEREPGNPWEHWRWTSGKAMLRMKNPKAESYLYLKADTDRSRFTDPQSVIVKLGDFEISRFEMQSSEPIVKKFPIHATQLGADQTVDLTLEVAPTFIPGGSDSRALGIRVYSFYLGRTGE